MLLLCVCDVCMDLRVYLCMLGPYTSMSLKLVMDERGGIERQTDRQIETVR